MNIQLIIIVTLFFCGLGSAVYAQTFSEWFRQKKTRIQYLEAQDLALAALQRTTEDGYQQEEGGLDSIRTIKGEEYQLHQKHFTSLQQVNPVIKNKPELMASVIMEAEMGSLIDTNLKVYLQSPWLNAEDRSMINHFLPKLKDDVHTSVVFLRSLVTNNTIQMSDAERMESIDVTAEYIVDLYNYTVSTIVNLNFLIETRQETEMEIKNLKNLFP